MLRFLGVRHLAVIEHLEVDLDEGLNIVSGETGAGKSILIQAIDLLLGGRASPGLVRTGEEMATIQAIFDSGDGREVIVRREISAQGRSRAFIDDTLATTAALRDLGTRLVDLHGQHEHQTLLNPAEHVSVLDTFMDDEALMARVGNRFDEWRQAASQLDRSRLDDREKRARIEMATFHLQEIEKVAPVAGEDEQLAGERTVLANAERLGRLSQDAYSALYEGEHSALTSLAIVWRRLGELATLDSRFAPYLDARDGMKSGLEDLAFFLRSYAGDLDDSPERLQAVEDRLAALSRVQKKYGPALEDVLRRQQELRDELQALGAGEERAAMLESEERAARELFLDAAATLSSARVEAAGRLGRLLEKALSELAMPNCRVDLRVVARDDPDSWTRLGMDQVEFYLSPNPGEELRPLARIASGGELSRVMLALHGVAATGDPGRTLVFDEVDAGVGGAAADAVGGRLQALAGRHQVICITHLPQVASRPGAHFQVSKQVRAGRTSSVLTRLDKAGRELEIARMIAGAEVSSQVLASARELLDRAGESEATAKGESSKRAKAKGRRGA